MMQTFMLCLAVVAATNWAGLKLENLRASTRAAIDACINGSPYPAEIGRIIALEQWFKEMPNFKNSCKPLLGGYDLAFDYVDPDFIESLLGVKVPASPPAEVCQLSENDMIICDPEKIKATMSWVLNANYPRNNHLSFQQVVNISLARMKFYALIPIPKDSLIEFKLNQFYFHLQIQITESFRTFFDALTSPFHDHLTMGLDDIVAELKHSRFGNQSTGIGKLTFAQLIDKLAPLVPLSGRCSERKITGNLPPPGLSEEVGINMEIQYYFGGLQSQLFELMKKYAPRAIIPEGTPQELLQKALGYLIISENAILDFIAPFEQRVKREDARYDFLAEDIIAKEPSEDVSRLLRSDLKKPLCMGNVRNCINMLINACADDLMQNSVLTTVKVKLQAARHKLGQEIIKIIAESTVVPESSQVALVRWIYALTREHPYQQSDVIREDCALLSSIPSLKMIIFDTFNLLHACLGGYGSPKSISHQQFQWKQVEPGSAAAGGSTGTAEQNKTTKGKTKTSAEESTKDKGKAKTASVAPSGTTGNNGNSTGGSTGSTGNHGTSPGGSGGSSVSSSSGGRSGGSSSGASSGDNASSPPTPSQSDNSANILQGHYLTLLLLLLTLQ